MAQAAALDRLEQVCSSFFMFMPSSEIRQPAFPGIDPTKTGYWRRLISSFTPPILEAAELELRRITEKVAGVELVTGPPKKESRAFEKAKLAYGKDLSLIKDYIRQVPPAGAACGRTACTRAWGADKVWLRVLRRGPAPKRPWLGTVV